MKQRKTYWIFIKTKQSIYIQYSYGLQTSTDTRDTKTRPISYNTFPSFCTHSIRTNFVVGPTKEYIQVKLFRGYE